MTLKDLETAIGAERPVRAIDVRDSIRHETLAFPTVPSSSLSAVR
jgi:hypothetical protein